MHRTTCLSTCLSTCLFPVFLIPIALSLTGLAQTNSAKSQAVLDVNSMDTSVDPCTDFFAYSCGGWIKKNPIPPDQSSWSVYGKLAEDNRRFLWSILENAANPAVNRTKVEMEIGDYFQIGRALCR